MMKYEFYDPSKVYMFPNGDIATAEAVYKQFPAAATFKHVIETDQYGEVMFACQNFRAMLSFHDIDATDMSDDEAMEALHNCAHCKEVVHIPSAEERIAAMLEFQVLNSLM